MSRDNYRSIGAISGFLVGVGLMVLLGFAGSLIAGFIFGAGGAVAGGIAGERIHQWRGKR